VHRLFFTRARSVCFLVLPVFTLVIGCASEDRPIAGVDGSDAISQVHITNVLGSHGIDCYFEGSIGCGVFVHGHDAAQATAILKADRRQHPYGLHFGDAEDTAIRLHFDDPAWVKTYPGMRCEQFIQTDAGSERTDLGGVLRQPDVAKAAISCGYIESVFQLERRYLDAHGNLQTGHEFRIRLADSLEKVTHYADFYYQAWDNATHFAYAGGTEGWPTGDCDCSTTGPAMRP
jgi:hypothetical protein